MRYFAIAASLVLLAGCNAKTDTPDGSGTSDAAAATPVAAPSPTPGAYDVTNPDGSKGGTTLKADGTYEDTDAAGKVTAKGTWSVKNGKTCFVPEGKPEECYTESARAADGSFSATDAKGGIIQVKPHAK